MVVLGGVAILTGLQVPGVGVNINSYKRVQLVQTLKARGIPTVAPSFTSILAGSEAVKLLMTVVEIDDGTMLLDVRIFSLISCFYFLYICLSYVIIIANIV